MASKAAWIIGEAVLTLINLGTLAANLSVKAHATVAGMDSNDLYRDMDFRHAVEDIVEADCKINGDQIKC